MTIRDRDAQGKLSHEGVLEDPGEVEGGRGGRGALTGKACYGLLRCYLVSVQSIFVKRW